MTMPPGLPNRVEAVEERATLLEQRADALEDRLTTDEATLTTYGEAIQAALEARARWWAVLRGLFR